MNNYITLLSEAREEARRLTKVTGRDVEAVAVNCPCDYSKNCYLCAGSGTYYEPRYAFCNHVVQDGDDLECDAANCAEREREAAEVERGETFPRVGAPLRSCTQVQTERDEQEAA